MKAIIHEQYGGPSVLELREVPRPTPGRGEVLVRVACASINAADYRLMRARPAVIRLERGLLRPKRGRLGCDFSGEVAEVGADVEQLRRGDAVFGSMPPGQAGAFAEFVAVPVTSLALKPTGVSWEAAAAAPLAGGTALQALRLAQAPATARVLVYGAGGGVGSFLTQFAASRFSHVTALCGRRSAQRALSAGADELLIRDESPVFEVNAWDVIFAVNGHESLTNYKRWLRPNGRLVIIGGSTSQLFGAMLWGRLAFAFGDRNVSVLTKFDDHGHRDLTELGQGLSEGRICAHVDNVFNLADAAQAMRRLENDGSSGKIVLQVGVPGDTHKGT